MSSWEAVADAADFDEADRKYIEIDDDLQIIIFKAEGEYYAVEAWCSHQKVSMVMGDVDGTEVMCPLHGACFDLKTGKHLSPPATRGLETFPVKEEEGKLLVQV